MTARRRWGHIVQRELSKALPLFAVGCASTPEPKPVEPPPSTVAVASASPRSVPAAVPVGLSDLRLGLDPPADAHTRPLRTSRDVVRFGGGVFAHEAIDWRATPPSCPLAGDTPCALYATSRDGVTWSEVRRPTAAWTSFSPGASVVYAASSGDTFVVDAIDVQGKVTRWLDDPETKGLTNARVVELPKGTLFVAEEEDVFVAEVSGGDGTRKLGGRVPLKIRSADGRPNAQGARQIDGQGARASWGGLQPVVLHGAMGRPTGQWALVWTHVIAPPFGVPAGKPWRRRGRGAKHDCSSGPPSRGLADPSVEKRITLTVLEGTKVVREVVLDHPAKLDLDDRTLDVSTIPDGVVVEGVAYDLTGKKKKDAEIPRSAPITAPALAAAIPDDERVSALAFDHPSGEGFVVFQRGDEASYGRRFDAAGAFIGEPLLLHDGIGAHARGAPVLLVRTAGVWLGYDSTEARVAWLTGPFAGKVEPLAIEGRLLGLLPIGDGRATLIVDERAERVVTFVIDTVAGTVSPKKETPIIHALTAFSRARDGAPVVLQTPTMRLFDLRSGEITEPHDDVVAMSAPAAYDVGGDVILRGRKDGDYVLFGLGSGAIAKTKNKLFDKEPYGQVGPPLPAIRPAGWVITGVSDEPVVAAAMAQLEPCALNVMVAPRVAVLGCSEPISAVSPGVRAGLRVLRLPTP